jgi:hypothetical protein
MRFLSLLPFLLVLKCGPTPLTSTAPDPVADQQDTIVAAATQSEAEVPAASVVTEAVEEEEVLRLWDWAWPENVDRRDRTTPAMTDGGVELKRTFVTDTISLTPGPDDEVNAIFVALIDFAAGKNTSVNQAVNNKLMSSIVERPNKTGAPRKRLLDAARWATRNSQREQLKEMEKEGEELYSFRQAVTTTVWQNDEAFLIMTLEAYVYGGGANGGFYREDFSFSTKTGRLITFKDVILPGKRTAFLKILHAAALADGHDGAAAVANFPLPDNFLFTTEGISFHYPEYSRVLSNRWAAKLVVPFSQLSPMLTQTGKEMMATQQLNGDTNAQLRSLELQ